MKVETEPKNAAYSRLNPRETIYPAGIRNITQELLGDSFITGAFEQAPYAQQELLSRYFGTDMSARDSTGGLPTTTARTRLLTAVRALRDSLPQDLKEKFPDEEIFVLKQPAHVRTGWSHSEETKRKIKKTAKKRATPEYRKSMSAKTKAAMTKEVRDKIKASQEKSMTEERKKRISRTKRARKQQGHKMSRVEATNAALKRWGRDDIDPEKRRKDPFFGALFNLNYVLGKEFPQDIRSFFEQNPRLFFEWIPILGSIRHLPFIRYQEGQLWHVTIEANGREVKKPLSQTILIQDQENTSRFGMLSKKSIREALELRMKSMSLFSQPHGTTLSPRKP